MALYYPQVKALVQGTAAHVGADASWDLFPNSSNTISSLDTWQNSMYIQYGTDGMELGDRGSIGGTGHCGMATTGSDYTVDLTKDFTFYFVQKLYGSGNNLNQATMCGFYNEPLGSATWGNYPAAPIPKNPNNFGITIAGWYMRHRFNTHKFFRRNSSTDTSFPAFSSSSLDPTNVQSGKSYTARPSNTLSVNWDLNVFEFTASTGTFQYHQHQYSSNGQSTWANTTSQGTPITDYYLTGSHFYDFVLPSGGWNVPSSIDLTTAHVYISIMNSSSSGVQAIIPRFGIIQ